MLCWLVHCRVVESKNSSFQVGDYVVAGFGWRNMTISSGKQTIKLDRNMFTDQKLSTAVGILGMPGYVTYFTAKTLRYTVL